MAADNFFAQIKVTTRLIKPTVGFEPTTTGLQNRCTKNVSAEKTKTCEATETKLTPQLTPNSPKQGKIDTSELHPDLAEIVAVWPGLPKHIKAAIKALIQTHKAEKQ